MDLMSFVFVAAMLPGAPADSQPQVVAEYQATPEPEDHQPTTEEIVKATNDEIDQEEKDANTPAPVVDAEWCNLDAAMVRVAKEKRQEARVEAAGGVESLAVKRSLAEQFVKGIDLMPVAIKHLKAAGVKDSEVFCDISPADETMMMGDVQAYVKKTGKK